MIRYINWITLPSRICLKGGCHKCHTGNKKFDKSLIQYLDDLGCLDERKQLIHTLWIDEDNIKRISDSGSVEIGRAHV